MKIVILDGYAVNPGDLSWEQFSALGELIVYDRTPPELLIERIGDAQFILVNKTQISKEVFERCPRLRYIGILSTGFNVVDTEQAARHQVTVTNIPAYATSFVAQHAISLLLECCNHVAAYHQSVQAGDWVSSPDWSYSVLPLTELAGKTIGIIGAGSIGGRVGAIAKALGMNPLLCGKNFDRDEPERNRVSLDTLLAKSDVISLHCPLTQETNELVNAASIAKMKDGVILINTARGGLVNERQLADALESGKIAYYAADVLTVEPMVVDCPLRLAKNCILTPHIAWAPLDARKRLIDIACQNLNAFLTGEPINVVS